ncbi:MAG: DUF992 domain-containing protein [Pseudomonadota bacterium]
MAHCHRKSRRAGAQCASLALLVCLFGASSTSASRAQDFVEIGLLDCIVGSGSGFVFGSTKDLRCEFRKRNGDLEPYFGVIRKFGLELGSTESSVIRWAVLAPITEIGPGALSGDYVGISAEATVGVGVGANALLGGGLEGSIALQPFSVQSQEGFNVAVGIAELELRSLQ